MHEYKLVKGFTFVTQQSALNANRLTFYSAEFPDDKVHSLQSNDHLNVEADSKVTTQ